MAWKELLTEDHESASDPHPNYQLERLTTKGDLMIYSTFDTRLPVGTDNLALTADSAETPGVKWASVPVLLHRNVTPQDLVNSSTETNILTQQINAGIMGADRILQCTTMGDFENNTGSGQTIRVKIKFAGATIIWDDTTASIASNVVRAPWYMQFALWNSNSSLTQEGGGVFTLGEQAAATVGLGNIATDEILAHSPMTFASGTGDTTLDQNIEITVQLSNVHPSLSFRTNVVYLTII